MRLRRKFWGSFFGLPEGLLGRVGARLMRRVSRPFSEAMSAVLELQPADDLLDVGCGSAGLLVDHAAHVRYVAGLDASELQVTMARKRLADRIGSGTAEIVLADAAALPWDDGRFSVVTAVNVLKFVPDPGQALREMHRVLRPGGRVAVTLGEAEQVPASETAAVANAWGEWQWSDAAARLAMEDAGFEDVTISVMPVFSKALLARGAKSAASAIEATDDAADTAPVTAV